MQQVQQKISLARKELSEGNFSRKAIKIVTAYVAACILYDNGQRSGVVTNLRIVEFKKRQPSEHDTGETIIPCLHHKTGCQGIARLVVTCDIEKLLVEYYTTIRKRIRAKELIHQNRFFLTTNGSPYDQVYRRMNDALSIGNLRLPAPKDYRIVVTTDAARELNDADLRRLAKHLSHSSETSRKYYEYSNTSDSILAHQALRHLSNQRKWSREHTAALLKEWPLTRHHHPGLAVCMDISRRHHMNRTGKQLLDRWRQLKLNYSHGV